MLLKINQELVPEAIASIGAHPASVPIFTHKATIVPYKLLQVRTPAANILKQEMLAAGGDAVVPTGCIVNADKYVDVLLLGTLKQYKLLLKKLEQMQYFGLKQVAEELQAAVDSVLAPQMLKTTLADGRVLTYDKMCVMGILNITPDSFYAGSRVPVLDDVITKAGFMLEHGAQILDIGGESTRPGSDSVDGEEERRRVLPVIAALRKEYPEAVLSVDTYRGDTAEAALEAGADIINDISAMEADPHMLDVAVRTKAPIILMHMRGTPKNMQQNCQYQDVVQEVAVYLAQRAQLLREQGVGSDKIILDPGIGFAKDVEQNLRLMRDLHVLTSFGYPVLLAASRKSTIGAVLGGVPADERLEGTIATSLQAVYAGAQMVRVHDVQANVRAIRMLEGILKV
ncbi:MAG: dihydropteroate synthase [Phascolarctobacterium sp.]